MNHMLSLASISQSDYLHLVERGCDFSLGKLPNPAALPGRTIGIDFRKTSTRTRTSFATAAVRLGAYPLIYGVNDLQTNTGESIEDTISVLSRYLEVLVIRTAADPNELRRMASLNELPIVNAMTSDEHPTQGLSDISMMKRHFGGLSGLRLLYCGEGNNTAVALAYAVSRCSGMEADFRTPSGYGLSPSVLETTKELCKQFGGRVSHSHTPPDVDDASTADVIYTTRWQTTGTSKDDAAWRESFSPFRVRSELFGGSSYPKRSIFMHDLPAVRGEDCDAAVLDGPRSICMEQAEQKLYTAMAVLEWCSRSRR